MSQQYLWQQLFNNKIVQQDKPPASSMKHETPWYIMAIYGLSGWLAAFFLLAFFASTFSFLFNKTTSFMAISAGICCSVAAYLFVKSQKNLFLEQLGTAISLCGQLMVALGLFYLADLKDRHAFYLLSAYQLLLTWLIPQYMHRFLSCGFGLISLLIGLNLSGFFGVDSAVLTVFFSIIWLKESHWGSSRDKWQAIGFSVAVVMVLSNGLLLVDRSLIITFWGHQSGWFYQNAHLINGFVVAMVIINFIIITLKVKQVTFSSKTGILCLLAAAGLIMISFHIHGLTTGLLIAIIGFSRTRYNLVTLGVVAILGFFSWYYYQLNQTLLFKSIVLIILGLGMMAGWLLFRFFYQNPSNIIRLKLSKINSRHLMVIITTTFTLLTINYQVYNKQQVLQSGERLIFKLAPVDPRSIMQGDFMRLRFEVATQTREAIEKQQPESLNLPHTGQIIVEKNDNDIVSFIGTYHDQTIKSNQYKIPYKYRNHHIIMITDAFYFQEGQAQQYDKARYGLFKSSGQELILDKLLDNELNQL